MSGCQLLAPEEIADASQPASQPGPGEGLPATLQALRRRAGLTQRDVAIALDVTPSMVHRWERGAATPSTPRLAGLAALLGVSIDALLGQPGRDAGAVPPGASRHPTGQPRTLRQLREEAGLTQWQLAVRLGVTEGAISRWESGNRVPDPRYLPGLAQQLGGLSVESLLASLQPPEANPRGRQRRSRRGAAGP